MHKNFNGSDTDTRERADKANNGTSTSLKRGCKYNFIYNFKFVNEDNNLICTLLHHFSNVENYSKCLQGGLHSCPLTIQRITVLTRRLLTPVLLQCNVQLPVADHPAITKNDPIFGRSTELGKLGSIPSVTPFFSKDFLFFRMELYDFR